MAKKNAKPSTAYLMRRFAQASRLRRQVEKIERACRDKLDELLVAAGGEVLTSAAGKYWLEEYTAHQWDTAELQVLLDQGAIPKRLYREVQRRRPKIELKVFPSAKSRGSRVARRGKRVAA